MHHYAAEVSKTSVSNENMPLYYHVKNLITLCLLFQAQSDDDEGGDESIAIDAPAGFMEEFFEQVSQQFYCASCIVYIEYHLSYHTLIMS